MSKQKLSQEERDILKGFEDGEFESILSQERIEELQSIAAETFKKDRRINIRLSSRDLEGLQRRALEEGMPDQTLVSSILHKYVSGTLHDVAANKSSKKDPQVHASS